MLRTTLIAKEHEIDIAGQPVLAQVFNGSFVGPMLRVRPGERIELDLVNRLTQPTNLHFHGLHVSPEGAADNIFRVVNPGETTQYVLDIPADHLTGTLVLPAALLKKMNEPQGWTSISLTLAPRRSSSSRAS